MPLAEHVEMQCLVRCNAHLLPSDVSFVLRRSHDECSPTRAALSGLKRFEEIIINGLFSQSFSIHIAHGFTNHQPDFSCVSTTTTRQG